MVSAGLYTSVVPQKLCIMKNMAAARNVTGNFADCELASGISLRGMGNHPSSFYSKVSPENYWRKDDDVGVIRRREWEWIAGLGGAQGRCLMMPYFKVDNRALRACSLVWEPSRCGLCHVFPAADGLCVIFRTRSRLLPGSKSRPAGRSPAPWKWLTRLDIFHSLCNGKAALNGVDLEACGAVVLHQLQRLSWSVSKGCLLPEEIVSANWTSADEKKIR